jgi:hypothetical protein
LRWPIARRAGCGCRPSPSAPCVVSGDSDAVVHRLLGGAPLTDSARFASRPQASRPRGRRRRDDDPEQDVAEPSPDGRRRGRRRGLPTLVLPVGSMAVGAVRQPCQSPLSCCLTLTAAPHPHPSRLPEPLWAVSLRQWGRHGRSWRDASQPTATEISGDPIAADLVLTRDWVGWRYWPPMAQPLVATPPATVRCQAPTRLASRCL